MGPPHVAHRLRSTLGLVAREVSSPVACTCAAGNTAWAENGAPVNRRQTLQWQYEEKSGAPVTDTVACPQKQTAVTGSIARGIHPALTQQQTWGWREREPSGKDTQPQAKPNGSSITPEYWWVVLWIELLILDLSGTFRNTPDRNT